MFGKYVLFGIIDNGIILILGVLGISLEKYIQRGINYILRNTSYTLTITSSVRFVLFTAMVANAISDFCGGFGVGVSCSLGTFVGCIVVAFILVPFTFKKEEKYG